jgi:hypothetical protein
MSDLNARRRRLAPRLLFSLLTAIVAVVLLGLREPLVSRWVPRISDADASHECAVRYANARSKSDSTSVDRTDVGSRNERLLCSDFRVASRGAR